MPVFLDTNVLLYSVSFDSRDAQKRERAISILKQSECVLSIQVLQEFYVQVTRTTRTRTLKDVDAIELIESWKRFTVIENSWDLLMAALNLVRVTNYSLWDCLILAAAKAGGCRELFTEDLSHGRVIDGVTIVNPFR